MIPTRRSFLAGLGGVLLAAAAGPWHWGRWPRVTTAVPDLDTAALARHQGRRVRLNGADGWPRSARLASVRRERRYDRLSPVRVEQFSLLLHAPGAEPGPYRVEIDDFGCFELELLPAGRPGDGYLQAACSRLRGRVA